MRFALFICTLVLIIFCTSCVARTYGLNEEQQKIAEEKYALSPGLNLVEGEPCWNTAKVLTRFVLAPVTLGISELALRDNREYPYQKYSEELTQSAIQEASANCPNYHPVVDIFFAYCSLHPNYFGAFRDCAKEMGYVDTQKEYWELMYVSGTSVVQMYFNDVGFDAIRYCASKSDKVQNNLNCILDALNQEKMQIAEQSYYSSNRRSRTNYGNLNLQTNGYGFGTHSDQFGRPVRYEVIGQPNADTSLLNVTPNAYGLGVHQDQFGRPVRAVPGW